MISSARPLLFNAFSRWIGTPWWNLRFNLGYWIGGFTHAERRTTTTTPSVPHVFPTNATNAVAVKR